MLDRLIAINVKVQGNTNPKCKKPKPLNVRMKLCNRKNVLWNIEDK